MENPILITWLNDFQFCPKSIYFHNLYGEMERIAYQEQSQINGTKAHETIDRGQYSTRKAVISGITVFSEQYDLLGKIDIYNRKTKELIERKKKIKVIYDGYILQLYGQYFSMVEMGHQISSLVLHSTDDNKNYLVPLPSDCPEMQDKFMHTINDLKNTKIDEYTQTNPEKCKNCIYEPLCDSSLMLNGGGND